MQIHHGFSTWFTIKRKGALKEYGTILTPLKSTLCVKSALDELKNLAPIIRHFYLFGSIRYSPQGLFAVKIQDGGTFVTKPKQNLAHALIFLLTLVCFFYRGQPKAGTGLNFRFFKVSFPVPRFQLWENRCHSNFTWGNRRHSRQRL